MYPCGTTRGHICLGAWSNPNGNKNCANAQLVNAARPKDLQYPAIRAHRALKKEFPEFENTGGGPLVWHVGYEFLVSKKLLPEDMSKRKYKAAICKRYGIEAKVQSGTNIIEDRTPLRVQEYWKKYAFVKQDSAYQAERERKKNTPGIALRGDENEYDPAKHHPADPSDPDAYVPPYVRFEKRKQVNFTCPITGWKETDWVQPISGGKIRLVGELTLDHKLARSKNGRTTDENTRMVAWLANNKKSNNVKTDEEIRNNICSQYKVISVPQDLLDILTKYGLTEYR